VVNPAIAFKRLVRRTTGVRHDASHARDPAELAMGERRHWFDARVRPPPASPPLARHSGATHPLLASIDASTSGDLERVVELELGARERAQIDISDGRPEVRQIEPPF
jgi:hypothetical protein